MLQARTALASLRTIARQLKDVSPSVAAEVERRIEHIEVTTVEFAQVRQPISSAPGR